MSETLAIFRGSVRCRHAAHAPQLTLSGNAAQPPGEQMTVAFSTTAPADCPDTLEEAVVEQLGGGRYRIWSGPHEWLISAAAVHLHREVAAEFYRALPPRPVPWVKRLFWRIVLALAASRAGLAVLRVLRR